MDAVHPWLLVHAAATWAMVGFIWTIQVLVYPTMGRVPVSAFAAYEQFHQRRVVAVLAPFAVTEVIAAAALAFVDTGVPTQLWLTGGALLAALWISTGAFYAPLHGRLAAGFEPALHARLVRANWARTIAWSVRGVLAAAMLVAATG
jgi:hypothetical protein